MMGVFNLYIVHCFSDQLWLRTRYYSELNIVINWNNALSVFNIACCVTIHCL